jgi:hypothetical protein
MAPVPETLVLRGADLERAVEAGIVPRETADRLADFVQHTTATGSEDEQLRLVTGFGDIFVTIGLALFLGALLFLAGKAWMLVLPVAAWGLAEVFTRWKRMALPSIALLLTFGLSVFLGAFALFDSGKSVGAFSLDGAAAVVAGLVSMVAVGLHWLRFRVPVTIAAAAAAAVSLLSGLAGLAAPGLLNNDPHLVFLPLGLAVFALAMYFDMADLGRRTPKTDMAFWLHLLAAPLIVHPLVQSLTDVGDLSESGALTIVVMFAVLSAVALVVDRRALLVSSLLYLGYALSLFTGGGAAAGGTAVTVLMVGAVVLGLSIAWRPLRKLMLAVMPSNIRARVPAADALYPKAKAMQ